MADFEAWLAEEFAERGPFTALILLVLSDGRELDPICSTYVNLAGTDLDWGEMTTLLSGAGVRWDGVCFFPAAAILSAVAARAELAALESAVEQDPSRLTHGHLFDRSGRSIPPVQA